MASVWKSKTSFCILTSCFHSVSEINRRHFSAAGEPRRLRRASRSGFPALAALLAALRKHRGLNPSFLAPSPPFPFKSNQTDMLGKQRRRPIFSLLRCVREAKAEKLAGRTAREANPAGHPWRLAQSRFLIPVPSKKREGGSGLNRGDGDEKWQPHLPPSSAPPS